MISTSLFLLCIIVTNSLAVDLTLTAKSKGKDIVDAIDFLIRKNHVFAGDDKGIFKRIAYAETKFGEDPQTYRTDYHGGIWQLDEQKLKETKNAGTHPTLSTHYHNISQAFNIDWSSVQWSDLERPLYSGIAARLYLTLITAAIPDSIASQATYWKQYYTNNSAATAQDFITDINALEGKNECTTLMDMVIVLDGSGSITAPKYEEAKKFVANLTDSFPLDNVRVGLILFSTNKQIIFDLNNNLTNAQMRDTIVNLHYPSGGTETNEALLEAIHMFDNSTKRYGVPQVLVVYTDGVSSNGVVTAVGNLSKTSIVRFSVGIGTSLNDKELVDIAGETNHNFKVGSYDLLSEFIHRINSETCAQSQKPPIDRVMNGTLNSGEKRYFAYPITSEGLSILVNSTDVLKGYYSFSYDRPSSALYDGVIDGSVFIPRKSVNVTEVYATLEGAIGVHINYTIEAKIGDAICDKQLDFSPCVCHSNYDMTCDSTANYRLEQVFAVANTKITNTTVIEYNSIIVRNYANAVIPIAVFGKFSFKSIKIVESNITSIHSDAFGSSAVRLENFVVSGTHLTNQNLNERDIFNLVSTFFELKSLDLSYNRLVTIPNTAFHTVLQPQENLKSIRLDHNAITRIGSQAFFALPAITSINLTNNLIAQIGPNAFQLNNDTTAAVEIDMSRNQLEAEEDIDSEWYDNTLRPLRLNLSGNRLYTIFESVFGFFLTRFEGINTLIVDDNPFVCGCPIKWLLNKRIFYLNKVVGVKCGDKELFDMQINAQPFVSCQ